MALNNDAKLQDALWKIGAFKGLKDRHGRAITYNTAVDGMFEKISEQAVQNAIKMGYTVDRKSGTVTKQTKRGGGHTTVPKAGGHVTISKEGIVEPKETKSGGHTTIPKNEPKKATFTFPRIQLPSFNWSFGSEPKEDNSINLEAVLNHDKRYNVKGRKWYFDPTTNTGYRIENGEVVDKFEITSGLNTTSDGYTPLTKDASGYPVYDRATNLSSTPAGIFTFVGPTRRYGETMYFLREGRRGQPGTPGTYTNVAFHAPANPQRAALFDDGNIKNNCTSYGCISPEKGKLQSMYDNEGSFAGDTVIVAPKDSRNYIKEDSGEGLLKTYFGFAPTEVSGKNYDKHYHFTNVRYNRGY